MTRAMCSAALTARLSLPTVWHTLVHRSSAQPRLIAHLLFFYDPAGNAIRRLGPGKDGSVETLAGNVSEAGDADGAGGEARLSNPGGMIELGDGDVLVADTGNDRIRLLKMSQQIPGGAFLLNTIIGTGKRGHVDGVADSCELAGPRSFCSCPEGASGLLMTDANNHCIRQVYTPDNDRNGDEQSVPSHFLDQPGSSLIAESRVVAQESMRTEPRSCPSPSPCPTFAHVKRNARRHAPQPLRPPVQHSLWHSGFSSHSGSEATPQYWGQSRTQTFAVRRNCTRS